MESPASPSLTRCVHAGVAFWTDEWLCDGMGVRIAFSERSGGESSGPFASLNLAAHVGDEPAAVDANRDRFLEALALGDARDRLTVPEQVHGDHVAVVGPSLAGSGAHALGGRPPVPASDALVTTEPHVPLMLCFADCVPVVLVAANGVAVAHAGWRGALASIPGSTALALARATSCRTSAIRAYIGPHIGACHYPVGAEILSQFVDAFGTVARAESGGLDLGAVVTASLTLAGVDPCNIARLGACTAETIDRFFSHRTEGGLTGRHGALACVLPR